MRLLKKGILLLAVLLLSFGGVDVQPKPCLKHNTKDFCWIEHTNPHHGEEFGK